MLTTGALAHIIRRFAEKSQDDSIPDLSISDPYYNHIAVQVNVYCNILSIIGGCVVIFFTFLLWLYDRKFVDRVSLRLNLAISICDIAKSAGIYVYTFKNASGNCALLLGFYEWRAENADFLHVSSFLFRVMVRGEIQTALGVASL
ncbi:uncharacterized protein VTP21DRAFT_10287 [Calcarisporiella thermophila]|uniref:uncharacterized protein n=1 Tax=Calcarisporiella thermophila TaxID=911321 RepID=UPI003743EB44